MIVPVRMEISVT